MASFSACSCAYLLCWQAAGVVQCVYAIASRRIVLFTVLTMVMSCWGPNLASARSLNAPFRSPSIRHVQGVRSIGIHAGIAPLGKAVSIDYSYHFASRWQINAKLGMVLDKLNDHNYRNVFIQPMLGYTLYSDHRHWFLAALGGAQFHIESHQPCRKHKENRHYVKNLGVMAGGGSELFLTENVSLFLSGGLRIFLLKSPHGRMDYFLDLGLKIGF